jgi:hypothetical protein
VFLTREEVIELTGYKQAAKQVEHLRRQRIPFHTNRCGQPIVARALLEGGGGAKSTSAKTSKAWSPKWADAPQST